MAVQIIAWCICDGCGAEVLCNTWRHMHHRCYNPKNPDYHNYGGRGIVVCPRWHHYPNFKADMCPTWQRGLTLDRIDVNGNYEPGNCRWATSRQQGINKRKTVMLTADGVTKPMMTWAGGDTTVYQRMKMRRRCGWPDDMIVGIGKCQTTRHAREAREQFRQVG